MNRDLEWMLRFLTAFVYAVFIFLVKCLQNTQSASFHVDAVLRAGLLAPTVFDKSLSLDLSLHSSVPSCVCLSVCVALFWSPATSAVTCQPHLALRKRILLLSAS